MPGKIPKPLINYYSEYLKDRFASRVQKISIHLGTSCPNRGPSGQGGCSYCNPQSFLPANADSSIPPATQLERGISRFSAKYPGQKYLAYVQGYTGTLGSVSLLDSRYRQLLDHPRCCGLIVGTRPDCIGDDVLQLFQNLSRDYSQSMIRIELGLESFEDSVLRLANRGCTAAQSRDAVRNINERGIPVDIHMILGLPGSDGKSNPADDINRLPVSMVKFHQFYLIQGSTWGSLADNPPAADGGDSALAAELRRSSGVTVDSYIDTLTTVLAQLSPEILIGRLCADAPATMVRSHSSWRNMRNYRLTGLVEWRLQEKGWHQGVFFEKH